MDTSAQPQSFFNRLLAKTGGWYVIIAILMTQITASITILLGIIFEQLNGDYSPEIKSILRSIEMIGVPIAIFGLIGISFILSRNIRSQIRNWKYNPEAFKKITSYRAWRDTHTITWRYALTATLLAFICVVIPRTGMLYISNMASFDQAIYSLIAGVITLLAFIPFSTAILDRLMIPVRKILLPDDFEQQLAGRGKLKLIYKNQAMIFISLSLTALLIAPVGYHQTTKVLYEEIGSQGVLLDLQIQSVILSGFAIIFASSLSFLVTRSTSNSLRQLLETFQKVEKGDLSSRTPVISSDEAGELAIYFNRMIARLEELQINLESKVGERTSHLQAINAVGRAATSILDPDELLHRVANLITEEFDFYYSAIYQIDESGQWAELKEATGEAGRVLKESQHRMVVDNSNLIGQSIGSRQAKVAFDVGDNAIRFNNPLLPYTRSEISLPLYIGNRILGALDVQSTQESAFTEGDIETLQNMANQVAISLDNARLFQETRQSLSEMRNIQKKYLREAWIESNLPQSGVSLAVGESSEGDEKNLVEIPISLRDQQIGEISIEGSEPLSSEEKNWVQAIVTQAALALENARLLEESQASAMREKFVTEINSKIWASTSIDGVLQTAVRELGQVLDASEATIEIDVDGE